MRLLIFALGCLTRVPLISIRLGWAAWDWKATIAELVMTRVINRVSVRLPPRPGCRHPLPWSVCRHAVVVFMEAFEQRTKRCGSFAIPNVGVMGIPLYKKIKTQSISPHKVQGDINKHPHIYHYDKSYSSKRGSRLDLQRIQGTSLGKPQHCTSLCWHLVSLLTSNNIDLNNGK